MSSDPGAVEEPERILLTGATGYVGGCMLDALQARHRRVRCLTRRPALLSGRAGPHSEVVAGDLLRPESLAPAMRGIDAAYYLVHSMDAPGSFAELDRLAATHFAAAARDAGVRQIVYLSGLGSGRRLSPHLTSRHEVGRILRDSGVATIELRASIVIGAGSASFEAVRALVEQLPAIPAPGGLKTAAQPIAIDDLIEYLLAALSLAPRDAIFEIGGADQVTYADVMREYARQRKLRRRVVRLPGQTLRASRLLLGTLTPTYGRVAAAMAASLHDETIVRDGGAREVFAVRPCGLPEAIEHALAGEDDQFAETSWIDALPGTPVMRWGGTPVSRRLVSSRVGNVHASPREAFGAIHAIGGTSGWYAADWFWELRGFVDRLGGGEGLRRGRRDPHELRVGDTVDCWRVVRVQADRRLLLAAEMKLPGRLWLQFDVDAGDHGTEIRQTTVFDPAGWVGILYWYLLYPVHDAVFRAMLRGLEQVAQHRFDGRRRYVVVRGRIRARRGLSLQTLTSEDSQ